MPNAGQGSGRVSQAPILLEPDDLRNQYFQTARTHRGHELEVAQTVAGFFQRYELPKNFGVDNCAGLDSSTYEGAIDERDPNQGGYPSSRIAITKVSHLGVDVRGLVDLNDNAARGGCINPLDMMRALGGVGALDFWFCSSNMIPADALSAGDGFRAALCNALRKPQARLPSCNSDEGPEEGWSLLATYHYLMLRMERLGLGRKGPVQVRNGELVATRCEECRYYGLASHLGNLPFSPNRKPDEQLKCPNGHTLSEIEALGLPREFSAEMSNYMVFHKFGMLVETLRAIQVLLAQTKIKPPGSASICPWGTASVPGRDSLPMGVAVLVDGPMAMHGQTQVLVPAIRAVLDDLLSTDASSVADEIPEHAQALVFGIIKTGITQDFLAAVNARAHGTENDIPAGSFWAIDTQSRANWITRQKGRATEFGMETHIGHEIAVKTKKGHLFLLSVPLPLPPLASGEKQNQRSLSRRFCNARKALDDPHSPQTPYLLRVLAVLDVMQSSLFGPCTVPQILAHDHASLSWRPAGDALMASVRAVRRGD